MVVPSVLPLSGFWTWFWKPQGLGGCRNSQLWGKGQEVTSGQGDGCGSGSWLGNSEREVSESYVKSKGHSWMQSLRGLWQQNTQPVYPVSKQGLGLGTILGLRPCHLGSWQTGVTRGQESIWMARRSIKVGGSSLRIDPSSHRWSRALGIPERGRSALQAGAQPWDCSLAQDKARAVTRESRGTPEDCSHWLYTKSKTKPIAAVLSWQSPKSALFNSLRVPSPDLTVPLGLAFPFILENKTLCFLSLESNIDTLWKTWCV